MTKTLKYNLLFIFCFLTSQHLIAQKSYTDFDPIHIGWDGQNNIEKIKYTKKNTIVYFSITLENSEYTRITFYPVGSPLAWFIETNEGNKLELISIKNIRKDKTLFVSDLKEEITIATAGNEGARTVTFSCEIHFPPLPSETKSFDIIEGIDKKDNPNHFNLLGIEVKTLQEAKKTRR